MQTIKDCNEPPPQLAAWGITTGRNMPSTIQTLAAQIYRYAYTEGPGVYSQCVQVLPPAQPLVSILSSVCPALWDLSGTTSLF